MKSLAEVSEEIVGTINKEHYMTCRRMSDINHKCACFTDRIKVVQAVLDRDAESRKKKLHECKKLIGTKFYTMFGKKDYLWMSVENYQELETLLTELIEEG